MGSPTFPEPPPSIPDTATQSLDDAIHRVATQKEAWAELGIPGRIAVLEKMVPTVQAQAEAWAEASCKAKGIDSESPMAGEEWLAGPYQLARNIRLLIETLRENGRRSPSKVTRRKDGQLVAQVFPLDGLDKLMFTGFTGDVWIEPGKEATQGATYGSNPPSGKVCLVLGAGNISCIGPMDVLHKLFIDNEVCILKMNPVNDYTGPFVEKAMQVLVDEGYMAVVYGGADVGQYLTSHDDIDTIHITGSAATHDTIVWGPSGEEQDKNKSANAPRCTKPISSELGAVTPLLVVPGPWTPKEIQFQAEHVAGMISHNASFDCNAVKVILTASGWPHRKTFLDAVEQALRQTPSRKAYYPGAQSRYQNFLDQYQQAKALGERSDEVIPWTIIRDVPADGKEYACQNEAFCGVVADISIEAEDAREFLDKAVRFANDEVWGTLSCAMLVHPETERAYPSEVDAAVADLRYGGIGYNVWPGTLFGLVNTTWGAFPGHPLDDIQSGQGYVHNTLLLDHPQKSVFRGPFVIKPKPIWIPNHKTLKEMGQALTRFEANPSYWALPGIIWNAVRG